MSITRNDVLLHEARQSGNGGQGLEVHLFGRMRVERGGCPLPELTATRSSELLAYLLLHRGRPHRREAVADLLWGDGRSGEPRKTLRQALWRLKAALAIERPLIESVGDEWIELSGTGSIWLDVAEFESAWLDLEESARRNLPDPVWARARAALDLYCDELLDGSTWEWCILERERLRDLFLSMADAVMTHCVAVNELSEGIRIGFEVLRREPAREKTHRRIMRLHAMTGDRSSALRQYERCVIALRDELGVEPGQRTRDLFDRIRDDRLPLESLSSATGTQPEVVKVLDGLRQLRQLLSEARREVHQEIEAIEKVFEDRK